MCYVDFQNGFYIDCDLFLTSKYPVQPSRQDNGCPEAHTLCQAKGQVTSLASSPKRFITFQADREVGRPVKKLPEEVSLPTNGTASELYTQLATRAGTTVHRLRVTKGSDGAHIPNSKDLPLSTTGLREQSTIYVKDLGTIHFLPPSPSTPPPPRSTSTSIPN